MNIAHLLDPYYMIYAVFTEGGKEHEYELNKESKGADLKKFNELISMLDELAQDEEIDFDDSFIYIALSNDGIELTGNFGEEPDEDEDEDPDDYEGGDYGNVYFQFDNLGNFKNLEIENA